MRTFIVLNAMILLEVPFSFAGLFMTISCVDIDIIIIAAFCTCSMSTWIRDGSVRRDGNFIMFLFLMKILLVLFYRTGWNRRNDRWRWGWENRSWWRRSERWRSSIRRRRKGRTIVSEEGETEPNNPSCDNILEEDVVETDEVGECVGMETTLEEELNIALLDVWPRIVEFPKGVASETVSLFLETRSLLANSFSSLEISFWTNKLPLAIENGVGLRVGSFPSKWKDLSLKDNKSNYCTGLDTNGCSLVESEIDESPITTFFLLTYSIFFGNRITKKRISSLTTPIHNQKHLKLFYYPVQPWILLVQICKQLPSPLTR